MSVCCQSEGTIEWVTPDSRPGADEITAVLRDWSSAWRAGDVDAYLATYAADFAPAGLSRSEWIEAKTRAFGAEAVSEVDISDELIIAYPEEPGLFLARFTLALTSGGRRLETLKRLYIRREEDGGLRIVSAGNG